MNKPTSISSLAWAIVCLFSLSAISYQANAQSLQYDWSTSMGTFNNTFEGGVAVTYDGVGHIYICGIFDGTVDFDPGIGVTNLTGDNDVFIQKLTVDGDFVWAKSVGGTSFDNVTNLALDDSGNVYTVGSFFGTVDFDPGVGTFNLVAASSDAFVLKLDSAGDFLWAKSVGGVFADNGRDIAIRGEEVYITGDFIGTVDFDPGTGSDSLTSIGQSDAFILRLDTAGNYHWAWNIGGTGEDRGVAVGLESTTGGNLVFGGRIENEVDLDPGTATDSVTSQGSYDLFTVCLDTSGNYQWGYAAGSVAQDAVSNIEVGTDHLYVVGHFVDSVDFDPGAGVSSLDAGVFSTTFVQKLDWNGSLQWAHSIGDSAEAITEGISLDASENLYLTGQFENTGDFDPGTGINELSTVGFNDIFMVKLDSSGAFSWATSLGSSGPDAGFGIEAKLSNSIFTTGYFNDTIDLNPSSDTALHGSAGSYDIFTFRWSECQTQTILSIDTHCLSYTWPVNNQTYTTSGFYIDTLTNSFGCDSILQLDLTILTGGMSLDSDTACGSYTWASNNMTYTASGLYSDTITSNGCDSIVQLQLLILEEDNFIETVVSCSAYTWSFDSNTYDSSGMYTVSFAKANGCDSSYTLALTIGAGTVTNISLDTCGSYTWEVNGANYNSSGVYSDTLASSAGCDSVVVLNLTINSPNTAVSMNGAGTGVVAQATGVSYQWLDCADGYAPISGANNQYFVSQSGDSVAVEITENGCVDTSDCFELIGIIGIDERAFGEGIEVYPNPSSGSFTIELDQFVGNEMISVTNLMGEPILAGQRMTAAKQQFTIDASKGVYLILLEEETGETRYTRLILQ